MLLGDGLEGADTPEDGLGDDPGPLGEVGPLDEGEGEGDCEGEVDGEGDGEDEDGDDGVGLGQPGDE